MAVSCPTFALQMKLRNMSVDGRGDALPSPIAHEEAGAPPRLDVKHRLEKRGVWVASLNVGVPLDLHEPVSSFGAPRQVGDIVAEPLKYVLDARV